MAVDNATEQKARVLVVEDDRDIREALTTILEMRGYNATSAGNGKEALEYLESGPTPDLIILDLSMPVMGGREFRSKQLMNPQIKHIPVVVVSALSDQIDVDADAIMVKPVDLDGLLTTVTAILRSHKDGRSD